MAIDYDRLMKFPPKEQEITYTKRDTMLYALGVGLGFDPLDEGQLQFVYEKSGRPADDCHGHRPSRLVAGRCRP
ncbi:MAG: hypothetical protein U1E97_12705 [Alphaproteobacteria bacterium]